jgi:predicted transcriptional regulator
LARDAFEKMAAYGITSLAIVDENFTAQGVISATDILYVRHDPEHLDLELTAYVSLSRAETGAREANVVVSCTASDNFKDILRTMLHHNVHHVYVLDDEDRPCGVVSFLDILRCTLTT